MSKFAVERLSRLLETERKALLAGDLETVGQLAAEKEALALSFDEDNAKYLIPISHELARNGALLTAARDGVTVVIGVLSKQRTARNTLSSYDRAGKSTVIAQSHKKTERRF